MEFALGERRLSRRYSDQVAASVKVQLHAQPELYYTNAKRKENVRSFIRWGILNVLLLLYILLVTFSFWSDWNLGTKDCVSHLSVFIIGCAYIQGFEIARKLLLIWIWKRLEDPGVAQARVDFFFMLFVVIPELGFYIYGNCTFYAPDDLCRDG